MSQQWGVSHNSHRAVIPTSAHRWHSLPHLSSESHPLICAHIKILGFLLGLRQLDASSPPMWASELLPLRWCCRKALATVDHWLYREHLMAQSWWILRAVDLLIIVLGLAVNTQIVTNRPPEITFPHCLSFQKLLMFVFSSFCATGDFQTIIDWMFCEWLHNSKLNLWGVPVSNVAVWGCQGLCPSITEEEEGWAEQQWRRGRGGESRGRLTDGLSEWIIDRGPVTDAGSINISKPAWWITADKQCWVSKCVFNKARWKYYSICAELHTSKHRLQFFLFGYPRARSVKHCISFMSFIFLLFYTFQFFISIGF